MVKGSCTDTDEHPENTSETIAMKIDLPRTTNSFEFIDARNLFW